MSYEWNLRDLRETQEEYSHAPCLTSIFTRGAKSLQMFV